MLNLFIKKFTPLICLRLPKGPRYPALSALAPRFYTNHFIIITFTTQILTCRRRSIPSRFLRSFYGVAPPMAHACFYMSRHNPKKWAVFFGDSENRLFSEPMNVIGGKQAGYSPWSSIRQSKTGYTQRRQTCFMSSLLHGSIRLMQHFRIYGRMLLPKGTLTAAFDAQTLLRVRQHCAINVTPAQCASTSAHPCSEPDSPDNAHALYFNLVTIS